MKTDGPIKAIFTRMGELRKSRGWSQYDIADKTGIHQSQIGGLEKGEPASIISVERFITKYANALGVTVDEMMGIRRCKGCINHLSKDLQDFVSNPDNEAIIKKIWLENELSKVNQNLNSKHYETGRISTN